MEEKKKIKDGVPMEFLHIVEKTTLCPKK